VLGDCELDAESQRKQFYVSERVEWSRELNITLDKLDEIDNISEEESTEDDAEFQPASADGRAK
jgi:hypothetical protein